MKPLPRASPAVLLLALGCYDIEPQVGKGYVGSLPRPGWPAPEVYQADPFHPANRLFQRLFVLGGEEPAALFPGPRGDIPVSRRESLSPLDRAEVLALLDALAKTEPPFSTSAPPAVRAVFHSDLLALLARVMSRSDPDPALVTRLREAALGSACALESGDLKPPPPLREAGWMEEAGPRAHELRPAPADLRWTRVFRREGQTLVVRLRIGARAGGEPVLLDLASEAWLAGPGKQAAPPRLFYFRRERLVRGDDPWDEAAASERTAPPPLAETSAEPPASRADQLEDARRALRPVFSAKG